MTYIEKHKLMQRIETEALRWGEEYDLSQIMGDIEDFPEADVVEVCRCKDCIHYVPDSELDHNEFPNFLEADGYCDNSLKYTNETEFCSSGRRNKNE